jgi:diacylglycerol kinase family enzyme
MQALLVVNPAATTTTDRVRDVLVTALAADLELETVLTKGRGHAAELAQRAADAGTDIVIALGGDGTVNEVSNGLLRGGPRPRTPMLAVVPGGSTNVFARALGYSASPVEATGELLDHLREGRSRRISLGHARWAQEARWFVFCAGMGLDAEVVAQVERKRTGGRPNSSGLFLRSAAARYARGIAHERPRIDVELIDMDAAEGAGLPDVRMPDQSGSGPSRSDGRRSDRTGADDAEHADAAAEDGSAEHGRDRIALAVVCNTLPWTYLGDRPVRACPEASFDTGLDLLGLRRLRLPSLLRTSEQMLFGARGPHGRNVLLRHDADRIRLTAPEPTPFQMDGEYLGEHAEVELTSHPGALRVIG